MSVVQLKEASEMLENRKLPSSERLLKYARQVSFGVRTGIKNFDRIFSLQGSVALLGEPEACKSVFALQIAVHNALKGNLVYFVDKELGVEMFVQRLLCCASSKSWDTWRRLSNLDFCLGYEKVVAKVPIYLNTYNAGLSTVKNDIEQLCESARDGQKVLLVLDSLQAACGTSDKMRTGIDEWLEGLDELKMRWRKTLTIISTVEKRRGTYGEASKSAGKESGRIEYKFEQQFDLRASSDDSGIIVECTKNRHGPKVGRAVLKKLFESKNPTSFIFKLGEEPGV